MSSNAMTPLEYALAYAALGIPVFPVWGAIEGACRCGRLCKTPGKHPQSHLAPHGQADATTNPEIIKRWWSQDPAAGIGIVLKPAGLVAVDVDPRNGGFETLDALEDQHGKLETDVEQFTQGGGLHRLFAFHPEKGARLPGKLGPGVDLKHDGYICVEPTIGPDGVYEWEASSNPLDGAHPAPLPEWIAALASNAPDIRATFGQTVAARHIDEHQVDELRAALKWIDSDERDNWVKIGFALRCLGQTGFDLWDEWSQPSKKYDPRDQVKKWHTFNAQNISYTTIFYLAEAAGWINKPIAREIVREPVGPIATGLGNLRHLWQTIKGGESEPETPPAAPGPAPMPELRPVDQRAYSDLGSIPGVLGEGVAWMLETAKKPQPVYALQTMLGLGSVVMGRLYQTNHNNFSSLFFLSIGKSATGKEYIKKATETILETAELGHLIGPPSYTSEAGALSALISKPTHISIQDELGKVLEASKADKSGMKREVTRFLMECWGRCDGTLRPVGYSTSSLTADQVKASESRFVLRPALTYVAMTTPGTFLEAIDDRSVMDGFLNRFLIANSFAQRIPSNFNHVTEPPADLVGWCKHLRDANPGGGNLRQASEGLPGNLAPKPIIVGFDDQAERMIRDFDAECITRMDGAEADGLAEMFGRTNEISMKLALIVAKSCGSSTIRADHLRWAQDYARHCAVEACAMLKDGLYNSDYDAAMGDAERLIREAGNQGMTARDLRRKSRKMSLLNPRAQDDILRRLRAENVIEFAVIPSTAGRGRKREAYIYQGIDNDSQ